MASVGLATLQGLDGHVEPVARGDGVPLCREGPFPPSQEVLSAGAEFKSVTSFMKPPTGLLLGFHGKWRPATPAGGGPTHRAMTRTMERRGLAGASSSDQR